MAIEKTNAAVELESVMSEVSSHKLISLLMSGMLERVSQAKTSISDGKLEETEVLINKIIAIINGLRNSLNFSQGGELAVNLENLYDYMLGRIEGAKSQEQQSDALTEVASMVTDIKSGWDQISP